jgi:hypothetical protein
MPQTQKLDWIATLDFHLENNKRLVLPAVCVLCPLGWTIGVWENVASG